MYSSKIKLLIISLLYAIGFLFYASFYTVDGYVISIYSLLGAAMIFIFNRKMLNRCRPQNDISSK